MNKGRLEAFSDGVLAIIITIMVLEIKAPESSDWQSLWAIWPKFLSYLLSFIYVGIYWNNHHHTFQSIKNGVSGGIMWGNLFLLFSLSLTPVLTAWMGEHYFEKNPVILYGCGLLLNSVAYGVMIHFILKNEGKESDFAKAIDRDQKGWISTLLYIVGIFCAIFLKPWIAMLFYTIVAIIWFIPDRRLEKK